MDKKYRSKHGGTRSNREGRGRFVLISPYALRRLAKRYELGERQHGSRNWEKGMEFSVVIDHMEDHLNLWKSGDRGDDHIAAIAWGAFAIMHFEETGRTELNDMPSYGKDHS